MPLPTRYEAMSSLLRVILRVLKRETRITSDSVGLRSADGAAFGFVAEFLITDGHEVLERHVDQRAALVAVEYDRLDRHAIERTYALAGVASVYVGAEE